MKEHEALCHAAFCMPPLTSASQLKLFALTNIDWTVLWNFFLQHKTQFITVLEQALQLLPATGTWAELLKIIEDLLNNLK